MSADLSLPDQIRQLNDARKLVLSDVKYYPTIIQGILPIIGANARLELRRWGANFLAEAFGTPALAAAEKETMQLFVLDMIQAMLDNPQEDAQVVASLILTAASIYPMALRWNINNSYDELSWQKMTSIKRRILQIWGDNSLTPVRISCVKFAQRVILAQTNTTVDARYGGGLDVSLDKVPNDHQTLDRRMLEGEAIGLLDRMLGTLLDNSSDALLVDATLNCLSILARTRGSTTSRIINAVLNFNPLKLANSPMTPRTRVLIKSMEKTTRMFLMHLVKRDPHNPLVPRMQQHAERLMRMKIDILDDAGRKRAPPESAAHDGLDSKRQRVIAPVQSVIQVNVKPLAPGPHSLAEVFTLTDFEGLRNFDVSRVPVGLAAQISMLTLAQLDDNLFKKAIEGIRGRLTSMAMAPPPEINPNTAPLGVEEEDDDYDPDSLMAEDTEQIMNRLDSEPSTELVIHEDPAEASRPFTLPRPPPPTPEEALAIGKDAVSRIMDTIKSLPEHIPKRPRPGFAHTRPMVNAFGRDRESWVKLLSRIAARSAPSEGDPAVKEEGALVKRETSSLSDHIRQSLYDYILEDFRKRVDSAITWLCEEWHTDWRNSRHSEVSTPNYEMWALKLIDGFLPYLNAQDKLLTRFLSEIPHVNADMLSRIKQMCRDPSVVSLALTSLLYLIMLKPPAREIALDTIQDIWTEYDDAKTLAAKYLQKYRPGFLEAMKREDSKGAVAAA